MRAIFTMGALSGALVLAGCADIADLRPAPPRAAAPMHSAPAPMAPSDDIGIRRSASAAEAACVAQGETQGMNVRSVVGTREVTGARDVMLRVARGQQVFDVRCRYDNATGEARIARSSSARRSARLMFSPARRWAARHAPPRPSARCARRQALGDLG
jgi:hypothetical protein